MNPQLTCSQRQWLHSSVSRASHRYREVTGSNPVEVLNFFFFSGFFTHLHKLRSLRRSFLHFISFPQFTYDLFRISLTLSDNRWTIRSTKWTPRDWTRKQGRPKTRWRDDLTRPIGPLWSRLAKHRHLWDRSREGFLCREWIQTLMMMMMRLAKLAKFVTVRHSNWYTWRKIAQPQRFLKTKDS